MQRFKKVIPISFLCLFTLSIKAQTSGTVTLSGKLINFDNQTEVDDLSEFGTLLSSTGSNLVVPDKAGNFTISFKLSAPNYFRLGRNKLYLTPGDKLEVAIDNDDPEKAVFKGNGAEANNYLRKTPFPKGGSYIESGKNVKKMPEETFAAIETAAEVRKRELAQLKHVSPEFKRLETATIKADLVNSYYHGEFYSVYILKLKDEAAKKFSEQYKQAIRPKVKQLLTNFADASFLKIEVYRDIADEIVKEDGKANDIRQINDYLAASKIVDQMQSVNDKKSLSPFAQQAKNIKTPAYKNAVLATLKKQMAFGNGDIAVDFTASDMLGKSIKLSDLKGKVIYVDIWATWCGPCMEEMPAYEKLKAQYKDNPKVEFVSLSIDSKQSDWKASIDQRKAAGNQWLVNRLKLQDYHIVGIPRTLLIDKDFKIIDMSSTLPSDPKTVKSINALVN